MDKGHFYPLLLSAITGLFIMDGVSPFFMEDFFCSFVAYIPYTFLSHFSMYPFFGIKFLLLIGENIIFHLCVAATLISKVLCKNADPWVIMGI